MNAFFNFAADSKVHDTVLMTMVITSLLASIRRYRETSAPIRWSWSQILKTFWNFIYDWATGFWSLKQGQPLHPITTQQLETHTDGATKDVTVSTVTEGVTANPLTPVAPAQPTKE